jgi:dTDP-4-dehydrorhamnose reductase
MVWGNQAEQKKVLLVTGGSGYLGRRLSVSAMEAFSVYSGYHGHPDRVKAGYPLPFDLSRRDSILQRITDLAPQVIIHTAGLNPGGSEEDMMQINGLGSRYVAEGAATVGARLIYVSTDVVHGGHNAPYDDEAPPSPVNIYGRSKAAGEAAVAEIAPQAVIVRTSLIYGLTEIDRGTAGFAERLKAGRPLVLFNDVIRQPIWIESLIAALLKLSNLDFAGTLNVVGRQALTREEFGRRMLDWWQVNSRGLLQSGQAVAISSAIPLDLRLTWAKAEELLQMRFPGVDEVLAEARRQ